MPEIGLTVGLPVATEFFPPHEYHRIVDVARMADDAGVTTVTVVDHVVMSDTNMKIYDQWGGFPFPVEAPWLEPLTQLAAIASATSTVRLGTGIIIAPLRSAPLFAKTVATLDVLSQGRVDLGVGTGWQPEEFSASGLDYATRGRALTDTIAACRALWGPSPAAFSSPTVSLRADLVRTQAVQPGGPPVLFSGTLIEANLDRITRLGDGWIPIMTATPDDISAGVTLLRERYAAAGRDPATLKVRAPLPIAMRGDAPDLDLTLDATADLVARGVTDVGLHLGVYVQDADLIPGFFDRLAKRWAEIAP